MLTSILALFSGRNPEIPDLQPALDIEMRLRITAEADAATLRIQLQARDDDVVRLQRRIDDLELGTLGRVTMWTQRRVAERLDGRNARGEFAGKRA